MNRWVPLLAVIACRGNASEPPTPTVTPPPIAAPSPDARRVGPARVVPTPGAAIRPGVRGIEQAIGVRGLVFSRDGAWLASGGWDGTVDPSSPRRGAWTWDLATGKKRSTAQIGNVDGITGSNDRIAIGCQDGAVHVWDAAGNRELLVRPAPALANSVALSPDGKHLIAAGEDGRIYLWLVDGPFEPRVIDPQQGALGAVAFTPDSQFFVTGGHDRTARIFDLDGSERARFVGHDTSFQDPDHAVGVLAIATSPDGAWIATGSWDGVVRLWDASATGEVSVPVRELKGHTDAIFTLAFSGDGRVLASGSRDHSARVWALDSETLLGTFTSNPRHPYEPLLFVDSVALSPDGRLLAVGDGGGSIRFYPVTPK